MLNYNATSINGPTFVLGYVGQALSLNSASNQYLSTSFIPLTSTSFTIDGWIYPTSYSNLKGTHSIAGLCPQESPNQCVEFDLHSNVTSVSSTGEFAFFDTAALHGSIAIPLNQWTHVAIVYGKSSKRQYFYVNGVLDNTKSGSNGFLGTNGTFYIGNNYELTSDSTYGVNNFYVSNIPLSDIFFFFFLHQSLLQVVPLKRSRARELVYHKKFRFLILDFQV
jgi:hypothetical protein